MNDQRDKRDVFQYRPGERIAGDHNNDPNVTRRAPWTYVFVTLILFAAVAIPVGWKLFAPEPVPTLLQDGRARTAYVSGFYKTCLPKQRTLPENASLTDPELGGYCLCAGRTVADSITTKEFEAITDGRIPASFQKKVEAANNLCITLMMPQRQSTTRERDTVSATNECLKSYHPEDTDIAAAMVRQRFCGCFAPGIVEASTNYTEVAKELSAYASGGPEPPATVIETIKKLTDYCSQRLAPPSNSSASPMPGG